MALIERIREEVAQVLAEEVGELPRDGNLFEFGLHSLAVLHLIEPISRIAGRRLDYADLVREPSLRAWESLCEQPAE